MAYEIDKIETGTLLRRILPGHFPERLSLESPEAESAA
jgi:hypothetical protein